jgi:hypothetical protein
MLHRFYLHTCCPPAAVDQSTRKGQLAASNHGELLHCAGHGWVPASDSCMCGVPCGGVPLQLPAVMPLKVGPRENRWRCLARRMCCLHCPATTHACCHSRLFSSNHTRLLPQQAIPFNVCYHTRLLPQQAIPFNVCEAGATEHGACLVVVYHMCDITLEAKAH